MFGMMGWGRYWFKKAIKREHIEAWFQIGLLYVHS